MATRQRQTTPPPDSDVYDDEFGLVTDADIAAYLADQDLEAEVETRKEAGFLNLQTASGLGLVGMGALYALQQTGLVPFAPDLSGLVALLPVLAAILIMLTGFGVLSWSPAARRRRKARERAVTMQRQARKTMGRGGSARTKESQAEADRTDESREARAGKVAAAAATAAFGLAGRAAMDAGRAATRAAELAYARQQSERRKQSKTRGTRLAKDRRNRKISGVAAGIANYTGLDPLLVRIAFVALSVLTNGIAIPLYFILSMVMPNEEHEEHDDDDPFVRVSRD